jgi:hypothetical protein
MKIIYLLFSLFLIVLICSCGKEEVVEEDHPQKFTTWAYKIDDIVEDGEEVVEEVSTIKLCHDTDNGIVKWVNGSIFGFYDNSTKYQFDDYCQNNNLLWEFYCEDEDPMQETFFCRGGCVEGHCV